MTAEPSRLVAVEPDLAVHIIDLLEAAEVLAWSREEGQLSAVMVPTPELERAKATLNLVLPGLLAEESGELLPEDEPGRLSQRLIRRSDWISGSTTAPRPPAALSDGREAFLEATHSGPAHDAEDDFVPQEPPPIPRGDTVSRFAWLGAIGGPILMIIAGLMRLPSIIAAMGLTAFVVGFGILVARMPDRAPRDDGPDNGAVL